MTDSKDETMWDYYYDIVDFIGVMDEFVTQGEYVVCKECKLQMSTDDHSLSDTISDVTDHWSEKHV